MFIGHFALGFGAKRLNPAVSLGTLFLACQLADLIWPTLVLLGIERLAIDPGNTAFTPLDFISYPYSHSLLALVIWGLLFGGICAVVVRDRRVLLVVAALVVSHWVLDWITHRPDMPLTFTGGTKVGLGLWNSVPGTVAVEVAMLTVGVWMYAQATRPRDKTGRRAFAAFVVFLLAAYFGSIGPPPPSITALVVAAIAGAAVIFVWAWWFDRHRMPDS